MWLGNRDLKEIVAIGGLPREREITARARSLILAGAKDHS
jgi:hypothetical protein